MAIKPSKTGAAHTAGIFADMTMDGPEIGTLVAVIDRARHLPNRKTMGKQDPYCAMRLGKEAKKTETDRRGGQTPKWDQELRFTVHESPDYYKMKCSVFNDDKKSDMIGEAWVDLREVIVPGGGQNDLWHPLFFKGKTAGEIRVEITYYDSRPQDEAILEKKRERERKQQARHGSSAAGSAAGGPRQFGPREVKRRPLPPGPGSATGQPAPEAALPHPLRTQHSAGSDSGRSARAGPPERIWNSPDDFQDEHLAAQEVASLSGAAPAAFPPPTEVSDQYQEYQESPELCGYSQDQEYRPYDEPQQYSDPSRYDAPLKHSHRNNPEEQAWNDSPPPLTPRSHQSHSPVSLASSPPAWPSPAPAPLMTQSPDFNNPAPHHRHSISPVKLGQYRDSPLRQSMTQYDVPYHHEETDTPPPPPAHRSSFGQPAPTYVQPQERSFVANNSPVAARSPLQFLERNYDPQHYSQPSPHSPISPDPSTQPIPYKPQTRGSSYDDYVQRPRDEEKFPPDRGSGLPGNGYQSDEPISYAEPRRHSNVSYGSYGSPNDHANRGRPQEYRLSMQSEPQVYRSQVPVVRPRAISPNVRGIQRKSVSPNPHHEEHRRSIGAPFAPDSYEAINPNAELAMLPEVETPEQAREAARQQEVEKLQDESPIVGNDGRIIDPSDFLPQSTWAAEPERKNRKPEHVIRFKNKEETLRGTRSSPTTGRPSPVSTTPYSSPTAGPVASPNSISPTKEGRNRLQKQGPARPLPAQAFQHARSSPTVSTMRSQERAVNDLPAPSRPDLPQQGHWSTPSPRSDMPPRPTISEYSLVNGHGYADSSHSPHSTGRSPVLPNKEYFYSSPQQHAYGSPREYSQGRSPPQSRQEPFCNAPGREEYNNSRAIDPLSAELSMIDIGPSRGGRTAARFSRGYGM